MYESRQWWHGEPTTYTSDTSYAAVASLLSSPYDQEAKACCLVLCNTMSEYKAGLRATMSEYKVGLCTTMSVYEAGLRTTMSEYKVDLCTTMSEHKLKADLHATMSEYKAGLRSYHHVNWYHFQAVVYTTQTVIQ